MNSRKILLTVVGVVLVFVLGSADVTAQAWSGAGRAKGLVTDQEGNPVAGATVELVMIDDRETGPPALTTNKKGKFAMLGLRGGTWWVRVMADGFQLWSGPYEIFSHSAPEVLEVQMEPLPAEDIRAQKQFRAQERLDAAQALIAKGDYEGGRKEYQDALDELDEEDHPVVLAVLAASYMNEGNLAKAKEVLERSLAIDCDHVPSLKALAAIVAAEGDVGKAEELIDKVPEEEVIHPNTTMNIGMAHYNKQEMEAAKVWLDRTIRDHADVAQAYYFRGLVDLTVDPNAAVADFEKFIELAPDHPDVEQAKEFLGYLQSESN